VSLLRPLGRSIVLFSCLAAHALPAATPVLREAVRPAPARTPQPARQFSNLPAPRTLEQACYLWQSAERCVRDGSLPRRTARKAFRQAAAVILESRAWPQPVTPWAFPLPGYGARDFDARSYKPQHFDYYKGTRGGAPHPAVDIFVHDRGQRMVDDRTGRPIHAVSAFEGLVLSAQPAWKPGDPWRGGVYCYVMEPASGRIAYYAHLKEVYVKPGQWLRAGEAVGEVGRSGTNALKRRSETHLHFMWMQFKQGDFWPLNPTRRLVAARTLPVIPPDKVEYPDAQP
jgi:hypothetical protein